MVIFIKCIFFCRYRKIIDCLESVKLKDELEEKEMNKLLSRAYTNLGVCYNKENLPLRACTFKTAKSYYQYVLFLLVQLRINILNILN